MAKQDSLAGVGHYLGTIIDKKWWKRYRGGNYFARGLGVFGIDEEKGELWFRRYLTKKPIIVPLNVIEEVTTSTWHGGKYLAGREAVVLHWRAEGKNLSSGFLFERSVHEKMRLYLKLRITKNSKGGA